jgi:hypothetical protein
MSDNKNQLMIAAEGFVNEVANSLRKPTSQKSRAEQVPSAASTIEENFEHTRRYSFDDNGGGYLGL